VDALQGIWVKVTARYDICSRVQGMADVQGCKVWQMFKGARYGRCSRVQGMADVQGCKVWQMFKGARSERVNLILEAGVRSLGLEDAKELLPVVRTSWSLSFITIT
jgi:hypothetical protein